MKIKLFILLLLTIINFNVKSQCQTLIGYWHNWNDANTPYIQLTQVDSRYNIICISFAEPTSPSDMHMLFTPDVVSQATFISQIQTLQGQGKKVLISIGGANTAISLDNSTNTNAFISTMTAILNTYHFDGIDIDIEHGNSILASGTIASPTSTDCTNLIYALNQIKTTYLTTNSQQMMLTFAPETAYVQGGMSTYGGIWGGYLPLINAFRNDLSFVHVQLYNSGSMYGINSIAYNQGTADFIIAMTEALIQGFNTSGGAFQGIPANKVAVGLPACNNAGGGFITIAAVASAINYLKGTGPKPGTYTLQQAGGYPNLGGMMTWSINWDKVTTCNTTSYEYATNFQQLFCPVATNIEENTVKNNFIILPNPSSEKISISNIESNLSYTISNIQGEILQQGKIIQTQEIFINNLDNGIYFLNINNKSIKFIKL